MTFKIEDGIPLPTSRSRNRSAVTETLSNLEVGQSFAIPQKNAEDRRHAMPRNAARISNFSRVHKRKFTQRALTENGVPVIRVWRTA